MGNQISVCQDKWIIIGYRFTGIECDAKTISVVGLRSQLASITSITIPSEALSVEGLMAGKVVTVDVSQFLPEGVRMVTDNGDTTIHIRLDVERLSSRIYSIDKNDIVLTGKREGYDYNGSGSGRRFGQPGQRRH